MRQVLATGCLGLGGPMFALGVYLTFGGGGFNKAESESAPFVLIRVYEAVQSGAVMVAGAVLFSGGLVAFRVGTQSNT